MFVLAGGFTAPTDLIDLPTLSEFKLPYIGMAGLIIVCHSSDLCISIRNLRRFQVFLDQCMLPWLSLIYQVVQDFATTLQADIDQSTLYLAHRSTVITRQNSRMSYVGSTTLLPNSRRTNAKNINSYWGSTWLLYEIHDYSSCITSQLTSQQCGNLWLALCRSFFLAELPKGDILLLPRHGTKTGGVWSRISVRQAFYCVPQGFWGGLPSQTKLWPRWTKQR